MSAPVPVRAAVVSELTTALLASPVLLAPARGPVPALRLAVVDGLAGAGKTTLAAALEAELSAREVSSAVVHLDDLYDGWDGIETGVRHLRALLLAARRGLATLTHPRYDWNERRYRDPVVLPQPIQVLIAEGCGCLADDLVDDVAGLRVFVTAPDELRLARGLARDGAGLRPEWEAFMRRDVALAAQRRSRERADVELDEIGRVLRWSPR